MRRLPVWFSAGVPRAVSFVPLPGSHQLVVISWLLYLRAGSLLMMQTGQVHLLYFSAGPVCAHSVLLEFDDNRILLAILRTFVRMGCAHLRNSSGTVGAPQLRFFHVLSRTLRFVLPGAKVIIVSLLRIRNSCMPL